MKRIFKIATAAMCIFALGAFTILSVVHNYDAQSISEMQKETNVSKIYPLSHQKAIEKSRDSAVQIVSVSVDSIYLSSSSGTYFTAFGKYFIITVEHGLTGPCELTTVSYGNHLHECKKFIKLDPINDYAIMEVEKLPDRKPIKIPLDIPKRHQWKQSYAILNNVVYTGYPNTIGPLTLNGDVVGYAEGEYIYIFSYAWAGSSGSGVFDRQGRYIGYIVAIDVGQTELGVSVLENVVLVAPAFKIDWSTVADANQ